MPHGVAGATLVHPGAASPSRRWPPERFAEVIRSEIGHGRRVIVTGGPDEAGLAHDVAARAGLPDSAVHAGQGGVLTIARLVDAADRVVCGDTGIAHLATALRTPSVVLFGPTSPALWGPPPDRPWHRALWAGTSGDPHGQLPDPGLLAIDVDQVTTALADLPDAEVARSPAARPSAAGSRSRRDPPRGRRARRPCRPFCAWLLADQGQGRVAAPLAEGRPSRMRLVTSSIGPTPSTMVSRRRWR